MSRLAIFLFLLAFGIERQAFAQSNDQFSTRLALTDANPTAGSNNVRATREDGEPDHAGAATGRSLWYTWTAPTSGTVNLSSYATVPGAPALRALAVYTGDAPAALTEVASSNDRTQASYRAGAYTLPQVLAGASLTVLVTAGTVYQIAVDAVTPPSPVDDDGTVILAINAPPTILSAGSVTGTAGADFSYTSRAARCRSWSDARRPTEACRSSTNAMLAGRTSAIW